METSGGKIHVNSFLFFICSSLSWRSAKFKVVITITDWILGSAMAGYWWSLEPRACSLECDFDVRVGGSEGNAAPMFGFWRVYEHGEFKLEGRPL